MIHFAIAQLILFSPANAHAFNCMHRGLQEQVNQMTKVGWVEEPGELGRRTEDEYATDHGKTFEEIQDRFAATGVLDCNGAKVTAQLTGDQSTISTVAHAFTDPKTCKKWDGVRADRCTFTVRSSQREQTVDVSGVVIQGFNCPAKPKASQDWAVLKLKTPLKGIRPYQLPKSYDHIDERDKVIAVNARNSDYFYSDKKTGEKVYPKTIEDCTSKIGYPDPVEFKIVGSTCDPTPGASGGSILKSNSKGDILVALTRASDETPQEEELGRQGKPVRKPFKAHQWSGYSVAVTGDFLAALRRATGILDE
ncbi:hypothetical protein [Bradyrhizobium neotropicale]|uniref:hypothetical protein n=1 Tax=Bradyrhizobium neotropicale TaxID=1497615 RepID=UPI001AD64EE4|nr:hypothetical protein [Bradyrhizobium neotropicale]MBO4226643.1 hypothetical protein [Bradyrhizobium neotropicale]